MTGSEDDKRRSREELTEELLERIAALREKNADMESRERIRMRTEDELRESERQSRMLFEFAPDAYYLSDLKGHFLDGNRNAEKMTGYKKEELIGKNYLKLNILPKSQVAKAVALLAKNAMGLPTGPDEFTLIRKDGSRVQVEIRTRPMKVKDKFVVLGIARDIAKHKKTRDELRKARSGLARMEKDQAEEVAKLNEALEKEIARRERLEQMLHKSSIGEIPPGFQKVLALLVGQLDIAQAELPPDSPVRNHLRQMKQAVVEFGISSIHKSDSIDEIADAES